MSRETRRRRAFQLFDELCDLPPAEQAARLAECCRADRDLGETVARMLRQDAAEGAALAPGGGARLLAAELAEDAGDVPDRIGRYRIVREIGRGGMGVVYEAEQDEPQRRVAVKVIREGLASREVIRRFQRESLLLGRLHHPGIAHVYEAGADLANGVRRWYFAMEYVDGLPLDQHADTYALSRTERVELVARVCDAVQHAHQKGILHRDLKNANVLVATAEGDTGGHSDSTAIDRIGRPKVVDFGIARLTDDATAVTQQTHAGQIIGSLACMSPEQLAGNRDDVDTRTDVYAIGVMLYRLVSGRAPHDLTNLSVPEAARTVAEKEPRPLGSIDPALRGDLTVIAAKALERDVERRYDSVAALGDDLRRMLRDEPIAARPATAWYRVQKFAKRNRALVTSAGIGLLLLVVATVVSTQFGLDAHRARRGAEQAARHADHAAYRAAISAAAAAIRSGDARLAREFLREAPEALRGWEWAHLEHELDRSVGAGEREHTWDGDTADFLLAGCWLSADEETLYAPASYFNFAYTFESFDAQSLRSLGHWSAPKAERCLGLVAEGRQVMFHDLAAHELVTRDLASGEELDRRTPDFKTAGARESYEALPADPNQRARYLRHNLVLGGAWPGVLSPAGGTWAPSRSRSAGVHRFARDSGWVAFGRLREGLSGARFSPDGARVAMTTLDRRLDMYHAESGERLWGCAEAHDDAPMGIAFSPDGMTLATAGQDRVIKLWEAATGAPIGRLVGHERTVVALAFGRGGETLYSADGGGVRKWRVRDAADPGVVVRHNSYAREIKLSEDGTVLASRVVHKNIIDAPTNEIMLLDTRFDRTVGPLPISGDAELLALEFVGAAHLGVLVREPASRPGGREGLVLRVFSAPEGILERSVSLGPIRPGPFSGRDGVVTVWTDPTIEVDLATENVRTTDRAPSAQPRLEQNPTPRWIDEDGNVMHDFGALESTAASVAVDPANRRAYVGTVKGVLYVFDLVTGRRAAAIETSGKPLPALELLPDGSRLFGGSGDTTIRVWDTSTLELVAVLRGHRDTVWDLAVSPDGATLYSASDDFTVRAWKTRLNQGG